jgi:uncharacterized protein
MKYFLDTYAMIEIFKGNPKLEKVLDKEIITSIFNLYELYYIILKDFDKKHAKKAFGLFKGYVIPINETSIFNASEFRLKNTKKNLSYIDCLGYTLSYHYNAKFVTGDKEFKRMENVEFITKE